MALYRPKYLKIEYNFEFEKVFYSKNCIYSLEMKSKERIVRLWAGRFTFCYITRLIEWINGLFSIDLWAIEIAVNCYGTLERPCLPTATFNWEQQRHIKKRKMFQWIIERFIWNSNAASGGVDEFKTFAFLSSDYYYYVSDLIRYRMTTGAIDLLLQIYDIKNLKIYQIQQFFQQRCSLSSWLLIFFFGCNFFAVDRQVFLAAMYSLLRIDWRNETNTNKGEKRRALAFIG